MASLKLNHIYKIYSGNVTAVSDFCLEIEDKEFIVLVGPSGCGKSTTLRMVAGLEEISEGELYIGDRLVNDVAPKDKNKLVEGLLDAVCFDRAEIKPYESYYVEHIRNNILCPSVHAGNAPSASALGAVSIHFLTLDITEIRHRDDTILIGNEIFYIHFSADGFDLCASFIVEFGTNGAQFGLDDTEQAFTVAENIFIVSDFFD